MLKGWNERKHCIVLGRKEHGGVGRVGSQSPRPPPAAWLNLGRKEVKAAALLEELRFSTLPPIRAHSASCGPLFSGLLCKGLSAPLTGGCISAIGTALPAPALNLNLVAVHIIPTRFPGVERDNRARPSAWLGCSLLQVSS